jgi:hypothetical protein
MVEGHKDNLQDEYESKVSKLNMKFKIITLNNDKRKVLSMS